MTGALLYMMLLGLASAIAPGVGIAGLLLAKCPPPVTNLAHVPAYGLFTWVLNSGLVRRGCAPGIALRLSIAVAMAFGICMEIMQAFIPGRFVDAGDLALNAIGIALAMLVIQSMTARSVTLDAAVPAQAGFRSER